MNRLKVFILVLIQNLQYSLTFVLTTTTTTTITTKFTSRQHVMKTHIINDCHYRPIKTLPSFQNRELEPNRHQFRYHDRRQHVLKLFMASPKSGGRPINSIEDFQTQVLGLSLSVESDNNDSSSSTEMNTIGKPILVYFNAPWCGPCRLTLPIIKDITHQFHSAIDVVDVCTDDLPEIAESVGVVSIPTIQLYYQGDLKDTIVGSVSTKVLASAITKVLEDVGLKIEEK